MLTLKSTSIPAEKEQEGIRGVKYIFCRIPSVVIAIQTQRGPILLSNCAFRPKVTHFNSRSTILRNEEIHTIQKPHSNTYKKLKKRKKLHKYIHIK